MAKEVISSLFCRPSNTMATATNEHTIGQDLLYKVLVIGELGTGKTSIIRRYVHKIFSEHYRATIGVDFALKVIRWDENTVVRLQLWDIAGQERFGNMTHVYYKEAVGAFVVFDSTRGATFEAVLKWKTDLDAKVHLADGSPIPCVLLANKCDLSKGDGISQAKMNHFCETNNFHSWYFTSAKLNTNIDEAARELVSEVLRRQKVVERKVAAIAAEDTVTLSNLGHARPGYGEAVGRFSSCC